MRRFWRSRRRTSATTSADLAIRPLLDDPALRAALATAPVAADEPGDTADVDGPGVTGDAGDAADAADRAPSAGDAGRLAS